MPSELSNAQSTVARIQTILRTKLDDEIDALNAGDPWDAGGIVLPYVATDAITQWDFPAIIQGYPVGILVTMSSEQYTHRAGSNEVDVVGEYTFAIFVRDALLGAYAGDRHLLGAAVYAYSWAAATCVVRHLRADSKAAGENVDRCSYVSNSVDPSVYDDKQGRSQILRYADSVVRVKRRTIEPFPVTP